MPGFRGVTLPAERRTRPGWIAASVFAHALLVAFLLKAYSGFVDARAERRVAAIAVVTIPEAPAAAEAPPAPARRTRPLIAPTTVTAVPAAAPPIVEPLDFGTGDSVGTGGEGSAPRGLASLSPVLRDRRLYARPLYIPEGGGRPIEMDSMVRLRLLAMANQIDSVMMNDSFGYRRSPYTTPSWVIERDGKKWGIDQSRIHLGTFSIPTAVLALLPFPQGNIDQARANARLADMRAEILRAAARSEAEWEFRRAVEQIRARRERERAEQRERDRQRQRDERPIN